MLRVRADSRTPHRLPHGIFCLKCRGAIAQKKRAVFCRARADVLEQAAHRGLLSHARPKGAYGEKFLTLTAPHVSDDTIAIRIARVFDVWPLFLRALNTYFREYAVRSAEWFRVFEWTIGNDELGHPHLHLWLFCPFLPPDTLREWWTSALLSVGCPSASLTGGGKRGTAGAIVHIEKVTAEDGGARELIKYLTKDITNNGDKIRPELYAEVYVALDGRRITQASRGFMARAEGAAQRCECGADLPLKVERVANRSASPPGVPQP